MANRKPSTVSLFELYDTDGATVSNDHYMRFVATELTKARRVKNHAQATRPGYTPKTTR